ncbi:hypothetical protein ACFPRL_18510 [Pseudoclavibacter helvolus]
MLLLSPGRSSGCAARTNSAHAGPGEFLFAFDRRVLRREDDHDDGGSLREGLHPDPPSVRVAMAG